MYVNLFSLFKHVHMLPVYLDLHYTEVRFASFLSGEFITAIVVNPPERKLEKHLCVHYSVLLRTRFVYIYY